MASIKIVFRKDKLNREGFAPIHFRIIKDRRIRYISADQMVSIEQWDFKNSKVNSKHKNSQWLNNYLTHRFAELQRNLLMHETENKSLTSRQLRDRIHGKRPVNFFDFAKGVNEEYLRSGKVGTYDKNASIITKLEDFVGSSSFTFQDITPDFLRAYERYLKDKHKNTVNTIAKDFKFLRRLFNEAYRREFIGHEANPFNKFEIKTERTQTTFLTEEELARLEKVKVSKGTRMELHRDMFVFAAYTGGMRVSDVLQLRWCNFDKTHVNIKIQKTGAQLSIKVPDKALAILKKYKKKNQKDTALVFPQLAIAEIPTPRDLDTAISRSTAYINKNLKTLAEMADINKRLSFHVSRHTFATRALRKAVSIEKVSKLMGHAQIRETMGYAKIVNAELDAAMEVFNG